MSWIDNAFFAPESLEDNKERRIMWAWIFDSNAVISRNSSGWSGVMSLPRVLSLDKKLKVDTRKSGFWEGPKSIEAGPFELQDKETLKLRIFIDKSVVEVFANDRQAVMRRIYPSKKDSVGIALFSNGGTTKVLSVSAWDMMPSNPY
ncbi:MAG: hypothetical protein QG641_1069 [Candidatus Poribacteria bacterium]|nr:hypothetical protein [Candidatus Poribacteria bacterium]